MSERFWRGFWTLLTAAMWIYFAAWSAAKGEEIGPFIAFVGMLHWALGVQNFDAGRVMFSTGAKPEADPDDHGAWKWRPVYYAVAPVQKADSHER